MHFVDGHTQGIVCCECFEVLSRSRTNAEQQPAAWWWCFGDTCAERRRCTYSTDDAACVRTWKGDRTRRNTWAGMSCDLRRGGASGPIETQAMLLWWWWWTFDPLANVCTSDRVAAVGAQVCYLGAWLIVECLGSAAKALLELVC